jgi:hypothetical protein
MIMVCAVPNGVDNGNDDKGNDDNDDDNDGDDYVMTGATMTILVEMVMQKVGFTMQHTVS